MAIENIRYYAKTTRDYEIDGLRGARDIGVIRKDSTRLSVGSLLSDPPKISNAPKDKEDVFKFRLLDSGNLKFAALIKDTRSSTETDEALAADATSVRFQILDARGRVVADNDPKAGEAYERMLRMQKGTEYFKKGNYHVRVSRLDENDTSSKLLYKFQLDMGEVKNFYETTEKRALHRGEKGYAPPISPAAQLMMGRPSPLAGALNDSLASLKSAQQPSSGYGGAGYRFLDLLA